VIHPSSDYLESLIDDCVLHTQLSTDVVESVFKRLVLEEPMAYALGLRPDAPSLEELTEELESKTRLIDDAAERLQAVLYRSDGYSRRLKSVLTADDKDRLSAIERSLA
jgi:hypothetical protein